MTAQEMFKELGYGKIMVFNDEASNMVVVTHKNKSLNIIIDKGTNTIFKNYFNIRSFDGKEYYEIEITFKEHQAIHQQMLELGWL